MESEKQHEYFILETVEVALIGLFSLVSVCIYSIILWSSMTSVSSEEEDRWSFKRSIKALTVCALAQNIYQIIFLIVQKTELTFNLLENDDTASKCIAAFEAVDQLLYCVFVYLMALVLMKPLVWPRLRFDNYIYLITTIPAVLNAIIRFTVIFEVLFSTTVDQSTKSSINTATSVVSSFLIYLVPLTIAVISTYRSSRRQPEHFLKVSCQRMGVLFSLHLSLAAVCFSVFSFAQCHKYSWNLKDHEYECVDHLTFDEPQRKGFSPRNITTTTMIPPSPALMPGTVNVTVILLNVMSQLLLPVIPASFLHTVRTILAE